MCTRSWSSLLMRFPSCNVCCLMLSPFTLSLKRFYVSGTFFTRQSGLCITVETDPCFVFLTPRRAVPIKNWVEGQCTCCTCVYTRQMWRYELWMRRDTDLRYINVSLFENSRRLCNPHDHEVFIEEHTKQHSHLTKIGLISIAKSSCVCSRTGNGL